MDAFHGFYSRWISVFDAPIHVLVDLGSNTAAKLMKDKLHEADSQLCPVPTEALYGTGLNERSHRYLRKSIDRLFLQKDYETGNYLEVLLAEVQAGWNYAQHYNNILPHYRRLGVLPRILGPLDQSARLYERIALMHIARQKTDTVRARNFVSRALDTSCRPSKSFATNEKVWFHRHRHGWRTGTVAGINLPTIKVNFDNELYSTHVTRLRPYFGELWTPTQLKQDPLTHGLSSTEVTHRRAPITDLLNPILVASHIPETTCLNFDITDMSYRLSISHKDNYETDSDMVFLTVTKVVKDPKSLSSADKRALALAKRGKIDFLLKEAGWLKCGMMSSIRSSSWFSP